MSWFELIADRKIRDAQEDGRFDNLPGKGKPLKLDMDSRVPPEQRAAFRLMRSADLLPDWIELDKHVRRRRERLSEKLETYAQRRERDLEEAGRSDAARRRLDARRDDFLMYAARELRDLNRDIDRLNLIVPGMSQQRLRVNVPEQLRSMEERFPRLKPREGAPWWHVLREEQRPPQLERYTPVRRKKEAFG